MHICKLFNFYILKLVLQVTGHPNSMKINIIHQVYDTLKKIHPETMYQYLGEYRFPRTSALGQTVFLKASASSSLCIWPKLLARLLCGHLHRTTVAVRVLLHWLQSCLCFLTPSSRKRSAFPLAPAPQLLSRYCFLEDSTFELDKYFQL